MLYWTTPEIGSRLVDVALSLDKHTKERYSFDSVLANYGGFRPTLWTRSAGPLRSWSRISPRWVDFGASICRARCGH